MTTPFDTLNALNREYDATESLRLAGVYGGIKALVAMVAGRERTAAQIMPRIQKAIAEHDREHAEAWAAHKQRLDELSAQCKAYMDDLRASLAAHDVTDDSTSPRS
jgi:hypothetical protein